MAESVSCGLAPLATDTTDLGELGNGVAHAQIRPGRQLSLRLSDYLGGVDIQRVRRFNDAIEEKGAPRKT